MLLSLQSGIIYGPVNSRRYGKSLGINLMPCDYKLCSFNCVYCHYGLTKRCTTTVEGIESELPAFDEVVRALEQALRSPLDLDLITFSGNGEPTLYPSFPKLVDKVIRLRNKYRPSARVALLSNATGLMKEDVRRSIARIDLPVLKLDAGTEATFKRINRPAKGVRFEVIVDLLSSLKNIYLQTVLVDGEPSNVGENEMGAYAELLTRIRPKEVHMYSIDRPVPNTHIRLVPPERLVDIARQISKDTGINVHPFYQKKPDQMKQRVP
jgi:wyosine [tRNA(Phe)-imidazoG37] synthetase (radical SAM superfamily)